MRKQHIVEAKINEVRKWKLNSFANIALFVIQKYQISTIKTNTTNLYSHANRNIRYIYQSCKERKLS